jgi:type II secretion system protein J
LIEVLIAVAIFAIVLAAINTVFYSALRLRNRSAAAFDEALPVQQAVAIIKRDLANLVVPGGTLSGVLQTTTITNAVTGQASPQFYTSAGQLDNIAPWGDIERVSYVLVDSTNRAPGLDLYRAVTRNLLAQTQEPPVQQRLMGGVQGLVFYFYDGEQWVDAWDSAAQTNLPLAIKVQIQLAGQGNALASSLSAPIELVVPVDAQVGTNQTQLASGGQQ